MFNIKIGRIKGLAATTVVFACAAVASAANTWHVKADGTGDFPTIQAAINAAAAGDTIILHSGTYTGAGNRDVNYNGKAVIMQSETGDPADCIIDCQGSGRGFLFITDEGSGSELHGVTVRNGVASGTAAPGGGIRCGQPGFPPLSPARHGSPYITHCIIRNCSAGLGGGLSCSNNSAPFLEEVQFIDNVTAGLSGSRQGGGLYALDSSPELMRCTFVGNSTGSIAGPGGGAYFETSSCVLTLCRFTGNAANLGGGVCVNLSVVSMYYCIFDGNSALQGAGMYSYGSLCNPALYNCTFYENAASLGGGVAAVTQSHPTLTRCIIAMSTDGEAAYCYQSGVVTINCCDIYGNAGGQGCVAGQMGSNNKFAAYPRFCAPAAGDLTLHDASPCAPANSPCLQLVGAEDVACSGPLTYVVCPDGSGDFTTIQAAIDAVLDGDSVELCDATYTGAGNRDVNLGEKSIAVRSQSGNAASCVIDCQGISTSPHRGFIVDPNQPTSVVLEDLTITNGYCAAWPGGGGILCRGASLTIHGCVISHCTSDYEGGGLYGSDADLQVSDCTFDQNASAGIGGGMFHGGSSSATLTDCTFTHNSAHDDGGGIGAFAPVTLQACRFEYNDAYAYGGGVSCMSTAGNSTFTDCWFGHNTASNPTWDAGGAVSCFAAGLQFERCTFTSNAATSEGGAIYGTDASATFANCTFNGNAAPVGGGISGGGTLDNTIVAFGTQGAAIAGACTLTCCDVFGNAGGPGTAGPWIGTSGNTALDPLFCNVAAEDFTLDCDSPCLPFTPPNPACDLIGAWSHACGYHKGDMNCDCDVGFGDINPFVLALTDPSGYDEAFPDCDRLNGDMNGDGQTGFGDINPFVDCLVSGNCP